MVLHLWNWFFCISQKIKILKEKNLEFFCEIRACVRLKLPSENGFPFPSLPKFDRIQVWKVLLNCRINCVYFIIKWIEIEVIQYFHFTQGMWKSIFVAHLGCFLFDLYIILFVKNATITNHIEYFCCYYCCGRNGVWIDWTDYFIIQYDGNSIMDLISLYIFGEQFSF